LKKNLKLLHWGKTSINSNNALYMIITETKKFFKRNKQNILLIAIVFLSVLLSFGAGMVVQFYLQKPPLIIENPAEE